MLFDVKEYVDRYPTLWRRRRLRGLWQKLKAILIAGYRYERTPTRHRQHAQTNQDRKRI